VINCTPLEIGKDAIKLPLNVPPFNGPLKRVVPKLPLTL
jgi:hypothetical protein